MSKQIIEATDSLGLTQTCYLVIQNADPAKPLVARGQSYFAVQTRRQELAWFASGRERSGPSTIGRCRILFRSGIPRHSWSMTWSYG